MPYQEVHSNRGRSKVPLHSIISDHLVTGGVSRQVKISLHRFGNCLGQVKINVTTAVARRTLDLCRILQQDSA